VAGTPQPVAARLDVPSDGLVCSDQHRVTVEIESRR
jgi:hypothetical protein